MKKVSIIVPIYNVEAYLSECIDSLLSQSYANTEIILVNDGSTDDSGKICDDYSSKYSNIRTVHQTNRGLPAARNSGLRVADGEYIGFVDSDDVVERDMYEKLVDAIEENNSDMAVCNFALFNKTERSSISSRYKTELISYSNENAARFYTCATDSSCNKLYINHIIKDNCVCFEDKKIVAQEDFWFLFRYCSHIEKISFIDAALYKYRERGSSISRSGVDKDITLKCLEFIKLADEYSRKTKRYSDEVLGQLTQNLLFASINQPIEMSTRKIKNIVSQFRSSPHYKCAISIKQPADGLRGMYNKLRMLLLRMRLYGLFSILEYLRVKRLYRAERVNDRFD